MALNPRIQDIKLAEASIKKFTTEYEALRSEALMDGVIDAAEQTDLDKLSTKLERLETVVREQNAILKRNRDTWDALSAAHSEFKDRLATLKGASWPDVAKLEAASAAIDGAVGDQRWADATKVLEAARAKMATTYQAYLTAKSVVDGDATPPVAAAGVDADKAKFEAAKAAYAKAMAALERHALAADAKIAPAIAATKTKAATADTEAGGGDFAAALATVSPLVAECAATEDKAHDLAHFNAILAHRTQLVTNPVPLALTTDPAIDDLKTEIDTLFAGAQTDGGAGKYSDGVAKLDRIPILHERRRALDDRRTSYLAEFNAVTNLITKIDAAPAFDRLRVQFAIDRFKAEAKAAEYATTNDYAASAAKMRFLREEFQTIQAILKSAADYNSDLAAFDVQMAKVDPHAGGVAIAEFVQARKTDRVQAVVNGLFTKFPTARQLLNRTAASDWNAHKALADAYVIYDGKRTTAAALIATVKAMPDTADGIAQAEALMTLAESQAVAKDIAGAEATVGQATARANEAKAGADAKTALDGLHDTGALDGAAADFPAALAVYTNMRANVAGKDTTNAFAADLTAADVPVDAAKAEAAKASPDAAVLRAKLDEGIALLQALLPKIMAHAAFTTHLATAKTLINTTLPPLDINNCIKPAIDACKVMLTEAETLAAAPTHDFVGAEGKLQDATTRGHQAQLNSGIYTTDIQPAITAINNALALIATGNANVQTLMAVRVTRLNQFLTDFTADIAAEDFQAAKSKAAEASVVCTATLQDGKTCVNIDQRYTPWVTNRIGQIQGGQPAVAPALAETNKLIADHQTCLANGAFSAAWKITNQLYWSIQRGIDALALAGPYDTAQAAARAELDALTAKRSAGIEDKLKAYEERYTAAVALGAIPQYAVATERMNALQAEVNKMLPLADSYATYGPAQIEALTQRNLAEGHTERAAIEAMIGLLASKYDAAVTIAAEGDPARAQTMMEEVTASAKASITEADYAAQRGKILEDLGSASAAGEGPDPAQIEAAKAALATQRTRDQAEIAVQEFGDADVALGVAADTHATPAAQIDGLRRALDLIAVAGNTISQAQLLETALEAARQQIAKHRTHAQAAYLEPLLKEAETELGVISSRAVNLAALPGCSSDLEAVMARLIEMGPKLDAQAEYVPLRAKPTVEPRLAELEAHDHSFAIQTNIEAIRRKLAEAARLSETYDPVPAVILLKEVETMGHSALVMAKMSDNDPPAPAEIQKILDGPGGEAELDAMIDKLEPDVQRAVLKVAFEARFGCKLQNFAGVDANNKPINPIAAGAQDGPNIKRFYEIMGDLPDSATADNDSMRIFTEIESGQGSLYRGSTKDVVMREGDAALSAAYSFGAEGEVGHVEPGCEPANEEPVSFFSWNTLHEVGHAVDDQHGFMKKNQSGPAFGGWTEYGANTDAIATVLAAHFKYDKRYIQQAMSRKLSTGDVDPGAPQPQGGAKPEEWEARRVTFIGWLNQVREPRSPWASNSVAQRVAIGGVVYQESYPQIWTSYQVAARSKGMTGYQFRAPGEWFSELYAAYHAGKLKPSHPAVGWLEKLDAPT
ncbi:MAG: hypothetical protein AAF727_01545 [Pseudomonadota bacterium]